jgi:ribosomal protein S18
MAFQFAPSTNVASQPFNAPQSAQMGAPVSGNALATMANLSNIDTQQQALKKAQATYGSDVQSAKAQADLATANAQSAQVKLGNEQMNTMYSVLAPYGSDQRLLKAASLNEKSTPDDFKAVQNSLYDVSDEIDKGLEARGWGKADRRQYIHELNSSIMRDPRTAPELIKRATQTLAGAANIAEQNQPRFEKNTAGQIIQVTPAQSKISNVGNVVSNPNPSTAEASMANRQAETYATDFTTAQNEASAAQPRIALFQNIKKLAPEAFTGVGGARKELATGIANAIGISVFEAEKTATDELAKNSALLSMAGGNTDAARLLAEAANPNKKMNEKAIKEVADQMIGVEKLKQAKAKFLQPFANEPQKYSQALNAFNDVNDFRIFQESSPEQVARLKSSMSKAQQEEMSRKIKRARELGLL